MTTDPHLNAVRRAARRRDAAEAELRAAVFEAHGSGKKSLREIADAAGRSHVWVLKLVRDDG